MPASNRNARRSALRLFEELPGIAEVVWAAVMRLASAPTPTSVLFTAVERQAGTSVLAAATAIGLAQHQRVRVCLVETDVEHPALAGYLGLESVGLSDILDGDAELEDCLQEPNACPGLLVLTAGTARAPVPGEFTTEHFTSLLDRLKQRCHYLVLDTAPVLARVESRQLLRHAHAALLVLRARATRQSDAERTHDILTESGTPLLGAIFNAYRAESIFGGSMRANRSFARAVSAERRRPIVALSPLPAADVAMLPAADVAIPAAEDPAPSTSGDTVPGNGRPALESAAPMEPVSAHRREVDLLERRIVKLTQLLAQTEADLRRIAAMKNVDLGIASVYRSVQGLSSEDDAKTFQKSLMKQIFQANLELRTAMARHS
jgi:Mrp family chromosome partitioning ATPase